MHKLSIKEIVAEMQPGPIKISERSPTFLEYITPVVKISAQVHISQCLNSDPYRLCWLKACNEMEVKNHYFKEGMSQWFIPDLNPGSNMIRDFYWYYQDDVKFQSEKGTNQVAVCTLQCNCVLNVPWRNPGHNKHLSENLCKIRHKEGCNVWLIGYNIRTKEKNILKSITWRWHFDIGVNHHKPRGQRTNNVYPANTPPIITDDVVDIPPSVWTHPPVDTAKTLIYQSLEGDYTCLIPGQLSG